jgi:hypothetical protein
VARLRWGDRRGPSGVCRTFVQPARGGRARGRRPGRRGAGGVSLGNILDGASCFLGLECPVSKLVYSDTGQRPTTGCEDAPCGDRAVAAAAALAPALLCLGGRS